MVNMATAVQCRSYHHGSIALDLSKVTQIGVNWSPETYVEFPTLVRTKAGTVLGIDLSLGAAIDYWREFAPELAQANPPIFSVVGK